MQVVVYGFGALGLDLPIPIPDDIPAPSDGVFVDVQTLGEWETIRIGTAHDAKQLRAAIKGHTGPLIDEFVDVGGGKAPLDGV